MEHISLSIRVIAFLAVVGAVVFCLYIADDYSSADSSDSTSDGSAGYQYYGAAGNEKENATNPIAPRDTDKTILTESKFRWHTDKTLLVGLTYAGKTIAPDSTTYSVGSSGSENSALSSWGLSAEVKTGEKKGMGWCITSAVSFDGSTSLDAVDCLNLIITTVYSDRTYNVTVPLYIYHLPKVLIDSGIVGGTVEVENESYLPGDTIKLKATAIDGYVFYQFVVDGTATEESTFAMPDEDVTVSAKFTKIDYTLTCTKADVQYGGNLVLDIGVRFDNPSKVLADPHFFIIAQYEGSKVINVYSQVSLSSSPGTGRIAMSSLGLEKVFVELVDGISSGLPEYYGYCTYEISG